MELGASWSGSLVRLRAIEPADLSAFVEGDVDRLDRPAGWARMFPPWSHWAAEEWIRQETEKSNDSDEFRVAIAAVGSGKELAGTLNTHRCDPVAGTCSYGIALFEWAHRQGYGREAVVLVLRYLFGERRYQKCTVGVYSFNPGSLAFHEALGFREEGRIRRAVLSAGALHDGGRDGQDYGGGVRGPLGDVRVRPSSVRKGPRRGP